MEFLFMLTVAAGGGFIGAAIGANFAFAMVGFSLLAAIGAGAAGSTEISSMLFDYVSFGPFLGPHIAFAGGVAASAYAASRGYSENGKDVVQPLAQFGKPDVLVVGAGFGVLGYLVQQGITLIPWFGSHTDSVALTVVISAFIARFAFGDRSLLNPEKYNTVGSKISPHEGAAWVRYQERIGQLIPLGLFAGIFAAGVSVVLGANFPALAVLGNPFTLPFAISAICIMLLNMGYQVPVTHHITISAGLGAFTFYPILAGTASVAETGWDPGAAFGAVLIGACFGVVAAFLGELFARLFQSRGNTHIDPPAFAIWPSNTLVALVAIPFI